MSTSLIVSERDKRQSATHAQTGKMVGVGGGKGVGRLGGRVVGGGGGGEGVPLVNC